MKEVTYRDSAKDFTLGQAIEMYELGIATAVNDGKDITVIIEGQKRTLKSLLSELELVAFTLGQKDRYVKIEITPDTDDYVTDRINNVIRGLKEHI